ncbi:PTP-2 [Alphabaculovirus myunipunctae]|uniref:PTP-2 n=1 Tax=Mythimna unipuncta nucleopolyhedrovirus TaxID=447897 RepID=A0A2K9VS68_9ABAC|nr:PTP-2 [Mythimna unipuncta nucleopolyhedrovirus]AUV65295.1 PTP-2 [Mythimna unipuncta nucleopolyhedrovirus]
MADERKLVTLAGGDKVNVSRITDRLYLGGIIYDIDAFRRFVDEHDIGAVLSVWDDGLLRIDDIGVARKDYMHVFIGDNEQANIMQYFESTYKFLEKKIHDENKNVFVHCHAGISRSATIVICYLMQRRDMTFHEACKFVHDRRKIRPNASFVRQLLMHEANGGIVSL